MSILQSMSQAVGTPPNKPKPLHLNTTTPALSPEKTMAANVANNLNTHGLLMQSAAARGERTAAARGLQHSTLGAEAAQRAMLDVAVPIAQVDTEHHHQQGLQRSQQDFAAKQAGLDRTHQLDMQRNQQQFTQRQAALDRSHQTSLAYTQAQLAHENAMKELSAQVSANTIGKYMDFTSRQMEKFNDQVASIYSDPRMSTENKKTAIENLTKNRDDSLQRYSEFAKAIPTTHKNWASFPNLTVPTWKKVK